MSVNSTMTTRRRVPTDAVLSLINLPVVLRPNQKNRIFDKRCPDIDYHEHVCGITGYDLRPCCQVGYKRCFFHRSYVMQMVRKREMEGKS